MITSVLNQMLIKVKSQFLYLKMPVFMWYICVAKINRKTNIKLKL